MQTEAAEQLPSAEYKNFRLYLQRELIRRCEKNPSYSLRSFARSLNINHGALSRILRGKRGLTRKVFLSLAEALSLSPEQIGSFEKNTGLGNRSLKAEFQELTVDTFNVVSEWYHDAILELMRLKAFRPDPKWIAKKLGLTPSEVNIAVERLARLELIEITPEGQWISHAEHTEVGIDLPYTTGALKKYQKQILRMALDAIDEVPRERRHNISSTVAIDLRDLEEIKKRLNEFRRRISKYVQRREAQADQVYQLGFSFYPLTDRKGNES